MKNTNKQIAISDLGLASLLVTLHFKLVDMEHVNEKRVGFLFEQTEGIKQVINNFWAGVEIYVSVQNLFNNQKMLKNRLFTFK